MTPDQRRHELRETEMREVLEANAAAREERNRPNYMAVGEIARLRRRRAIADKPERGFPDYPDRSPRTP